LLEWQGQSITQHYSDFFSSTGALCLYLLSKKMIKTMIKQGFSGLFRFYSRVLQLNTKLIEFLDISIQKILYLLAGKVCNYYLVCSG